MIFSPELNMMLVPIKITCQTCKGLKTVINPNKWIEQVKKIKLVSLPDLVKSPCKDCDGVGFYTVNHL